MSAALVAAFTAHRRQFLAGVMRRLEGVTNVEHTSTPELLLHRLDVKGYDLLLLDLELAEAAGVSNVLLGASSRPGCAVILTGDPAAPIAPPTMRALQLGTAWFVELPPASGPADADELLAGLQRIAKTLAGRRRAAGGPGLAAPERSPIVASGGSTATRRFWCAAVGVSTGGPEALGELIPRLPGDFALPVLVVQHMPAVFTRSLADRLDARSPLRVVEAVAGDAVVAGTVYIAPGGRHMTVVHERGYPVIVLNDDPPVHSCRPAVDVLFESIARLAERRGVLAVVMTGMGYDGTAGVRALKQSKSTWCITQSEASCVVYGMPRAVDAAGLSDESVPLIRIADRIVQRATG